jgi:dopamine beta-monooxygenase
LLQSSVSDSDNFHQKMFFFESALVLSVIITNLSFFVGVRGYGSFLDKIPNGRNVTHPCFPNSQWSGVGHIVDGGGGTTNLFGIDFKQAGYKWTTSLCQKDSDNDGSTNGQELGDPNCSWTPGTTPFRTTNISHPGVCNPCGTAKCNETNKVFGPALYVSPIFDCPAAQGAFKRDYRLSLTQVPSDETTYMCQAFEISTNETLYMVANEPVVNNSNVLHHMLAYGCASRPDQTKLDKPFPCFMSDSSCRTLMAIWGYGFKGECLDSNINVKMGNSSFSYMMIQVHWNNPSRQTNYWDNSGFRFHFTSTPRQYVAGMMMIGQTSLELPPGSLSINATSNCNAATTSMNWGNKGVSSVYIAAAAAHMHLRGRYSSIEQYRNNVKVTDVVPYQQTLYSNPPFIQFAAKEVKAGDELRMVCTFTTIGESSTVYYGESTNDEMCFGFLRYYPQLSGDENCVNYGPYVNNAPMVQAQMGMNISGCILSQFLATAQSSYTTKILMACPLDVQGCAPACKPIVQALMQDPCMQGWPRKYLLFLTRFNPQVSSVMTNLTLYSSPCETALRQATQMTTSSPSTGNNTGFSTDSQLALLIAGAVVAFALLLIVCITLLVKAICLSSSGNTPGYKSYDVSMNVYDSSASPKPPVNENGYTIQRVL